MKFTIKKKIIAMLAITVTVPLFIVFLVVTNELKNSTVENFTNSSLKEITQIDNVLTTFFTQMQQIVTLVATAELSVESSNGLLSKYIGKDIPIGSVPKSEKEQQLIKYFKHLFESFPDLTYVFIGAKDKGYAMFPEEGTLSDYDPTQTAYYKGGLLAGSSPYISEPTYYTSVNMYIIDIVFPIKNMNEIIGVAGINVSLETLTNIVKDIKIGETGHMMVTSAKNIVLADPFNADNMKKDIGDLKNGYEKFKDISGGFGEVSLYNKDYYYYVYTSQELGWKYIMTITRAEALSSYYFFIKTIAFIIIVLLVVFITVGVFFANSITRPINSIKNMLETIAKGGGDLTQKITVTTNDELKELSEWFNKFILSLAALINQIKQNSTNVAAASSELAATTEQLSSTLNSQAAQVSEIAMSTENMGQTSTNVLNLLQTSNQSIIAMTDYTKTGTGKLDSTVKEITNIKENIDQLSKTAESLVNYTSEIGRILSVVTDIADQTNLLALNAAIEAARAGDAGKGFAVVADEVRKLAERTQKATSEIGGIVQNLEKNSNELTQDMSLAVERVQGGVESIIELSQTFEEIVNAVDISKNNNDQITTAISEQVQGVQNVNSNTQSISSGVIESSSAVAEVSRTVSDLEQQASSLNNLVGNFKTE